MSVVETIEAFEDGLMWIGLSALAAIAVGVVGAWLYRGVASAMRRLLTVARIVAFVVVSAFCVIRGGATFLMPPPSTGGTPVVPVVVTSEEIAQGWRLESVTTNDAVSYAMPTNGVEYMPWLLGGGYEMHFPLDLGDFAFPFGTGVVHRLDVVNSEGKICYTKTTSRQAAAFFNEYEAAEGVTMYFVGAITNSNAVGFRSGSNVVIGKESPKEGLAHELGHYLGLKDIYYVKVGKYNGESACIRLRIRNDPVSFETFKSRTGDWGDETGRGFYERNDTVASVIDRLLMHGVKKQTDGGDIPDDQVYGISKDDQKGFQNVGASNFDD